MMVTKRIKFYLLITAAIILGFVPILHLPFGWMETYFHEISHGLAAILTGGKIDNIALRLNGEGICYTRGGILFFIAFAGYAGAVAWGCALYLIAGDLPPKSAHNLAKGLAIAVLLSALLWVRDVMSFVIIAFIISIFWLALKMRPDSRLPQLLLQFSGMYVMLGAIRSPLYLIDGKEVGDGANLEKLTGIPEFLWVVVWCALAIFGLITVARLSSRKKDDAQNGFT